MNDFHSNNPTISPAGDERELLSLLIDGQLPPQEQAQIQARLLRQELSREKYIQFIQLHAMLRWVAAPSQGDAPRAAESVAAAPLAMTVAPAAQAIAYQTWHDYFDWRQSPLRFGALVLSITLALWAAFFSALFPRERSNDRSPAPSGQVAFVADARLVGAYQAQWSEGELEVGSEIARDAKLRLDAGLVELEFGRGARVILQGPCEVSVRHGNAMNLHRGMLVARVPKRANGFQVVTPRTIVRDLGTEFGVDLNDATTLEVEVFAGEVELLPGDDGQAVPIAQENQRGVPVRAGEKVRIGTEQSLNEAVIQAKNGDPTAPPAEPKTFVRQMPAGTERESAAGSRLENLAKGGAITQSAEYVRGSDVVPPEWANDGDLKTFSVTDSRDADAWLQIDLGGMHEIRSILLWNRADGNVAGRLRDITVEILADDGATILAASPLLNPNNEWGGGRLNFHDGPHGGRIRWNATAEKTPFVGRYVRVRRVVLDANEAAFQGEGESDRSNRRVLSLAEVQVYGIRSQTNSSSVKGGNRSE